MDSLINQNIDEKLNLYYFNVFMTVDTEIFRDFAINR